MFKFLIGWSGSFHLSTNRALMISISAPLSTNASASCPAIVTGRRSDRSILGNSYPYSWCSSDVPLTAPTLGAVSLATGVVSPATSVVSLTIGVVSLTTSVVSLTTGVVSLATGVESLATDVEPLNLEAEGSILLHPLGVGNAPSISLDPFLGFIRFWGGEIVGI
jgi:hypothetical protein